MAKQLFANNAGSMLAVSISAVDTAVQVGGGHGALFPLPSGGDYFLVTLIDAAGNREVVKCTSRSSDVLTVVRGQESTTAQAWVGNACRVEARLTKGTVERFVQTDGDYTILGELTLTGGISGGININDAGDVKLLFDDKKLVFGAGEDFEIYHDGTSNYLESLNGTIKLLNQNAAYLELEVSASGHVQLRGTGPSFRTYETDADADEKMWGMGGDSSGTWTLRTRFDDGSTGENAISVSRNAEAVDVVRLFGETRLDALNSNSVVRSGQYTPTYTADLNCGALVAQGDAFYTRVGDIVHVQGRVTVTPSAAGVVGFDISLPIASAFSASTSLRGLMAAAAAVHSSGRIGADATNDRAEAFFTAASTSSETFDFSFMYLIEA